MAYTYGANIQSNPNAAYNLWGSTGPSNPYITQGPGYTPGSYPTNQQQQSSLLPMTINVPRPGFNDTDGTPMHYSPSGDKSASWYRNEYGDANAAREAAIAGDIHTAYILDHLNWRQKNDIGDFDLLNTKYPGNVELGIPSDKQKMDNYFGAKQLAGAMIPGASLLGIKNYYDGGEFQTWQDMQNTPLPGVVQNQTPMITPIWNGQTLFNANKQNEPGFDASDHSTYTNIPVGNSLMDEPLEVAQNYVVHPLSQTVSETVFPSFSAGSFSDTYNAAPVTSAAPANLNTVVSDDGDEEEAWYANNGYY